MKQNLIRLIWKEKEASVLRDDVQKGFENLLPLFNKKTALLNDLHIKQTDNLYKLKSENLDSFFELISTDNQIIDEINVIDFKISKHIDGICRKSGIERNYFNDLIQNSSDKTITDINEASEAIHKKALSIYHDRNKLISLMEKKSRELSRDINDLSKIRNLKVRI